MDNYVTIFDTTLRDGEQSPGCSMNKQEKLQVARVLDELGVDVIEAGFPAASPGDFESVKAIGELGLGSRIAGLARARQGDIEAVARSLENCKHKRLHTFIATSPIHREFKLKMDKQEIIDGMVEAVEFGKQWFDDIEVSAEDACRTELEYLVEFFQAAIDAGATTLNVPDTVGYTTPREAREMFKYIVDNLQNADHAILSCHNHNDLGLAVANSLGAVDGGARQVECTVNGIGERAGNASLEEVVMALRTRHDRYGLETGIDATRLYPASRLVSAVTGSRVQPNKAIVGRNAFAHEAGIHQDGILKHAETYEIMKPESVGVPENNLVLGKHSGRHAFRKRLEALGFSMEDEAMNELFDKFKSLADRKKSVYDEDIEALVLGTEQSGPWHLDAISIHTEVVDDDQSAEASLKLRYNGQAPRIYTGRGDGPVNAIVNAIRAILEEDLHMERFQVSAVTHGSDAQGRATVRATIGPNRYKGTGVSTDIVEAAAHAMVSIMNRHQQHQGRLPDEDRLKAAV
ncbi:MAG: 2-isopropylmalate synthase [Xanthomonadales bacterium]|nr:2-isopropylmalate synthase [Gammaproteobacteria bacterium]MBT8051612.1 2-isopropylmalate synthase [Gammaproteobacteria bacterium]MBT8055484.1 2-isopropylmalate synthase [Gammaproteobacteria bacterium]NNJ77717.1 2-isopropylmalate synthase [Xanthomonadales bacterium]NNL04920.1 2-isopropylmalate synthase [Xanthomonadales bacterium]